MNHWAVVIGVDRYAAPHLNLIVPVPPGLQSFSTEVDLRPGVNILVGIDAALDGATGIVTWKFTTLDPATHELPEDPEFGFLPPNVTPFGSEYAIAAAATNSITAPRLTTWLLFSR